MRTFSYFFAVLAGVATLTSLVTAQAPANPPNASPETPASSASAPAKAYVQPTEKIKFRNYVFDAFGPYTIVGAALAAGINQANNTPPEWKQGAEGYGRRFGSNLGIAVVSTTTRYALAEALHEDTLYYRCECTGALPRLKHALISTWTARRGEDGHTVFSLPAVVGPYAGSMTAVYAWFPDRYGAKDAFRMGNYGLLAYMGGNVALEFLYGGPHTLLSRMRRKGGHSTPSQGSNP